VEDYVPIAHLSDKRVTPRFLASIIETRGMDIFAKLTPAGDLHPVPLQWVVFPPSMEIHSPDFMTRLLNPSLKT
jgi:hypothetical protein